MAQPKNILSNNGYPKKGDYVIKVGEILFLNWKNADISHVNITFYKGNEPIPLTNKEVIDGENGFSIFIDSSFFTEEFRECQAVVELKEDPNIYVETPIFKVLRTDDRNA